MDAGRSEVSGDDVASRCITFLPGWLRKEFMKCFRERKTRGCFTAESVRTLNMSTVYVCNGCHSYRKPTHLRSACKQPLDRRSMAGDRGSPRLY
ncbi:unnamed protein product [Allacma fusca]|uniref:Uncharacterized protein n=1 Tax=Allacma fusca TaxID=39272 RepID=A0A8J2K3S7_9HEXA|nr:unnamed protein product [Allacma fusca]